MEWLISKLELFSAVYTFLGQYRFYQAISVEALPGRDPNLVDLQYSLRIDANYFYSIAALVRIVIQYLRNAELLTPTTTTSASGASRSTSADSDIETWLVSNKTSNLPGPLGNENTITIKLVRKPGGKRWQLISNNEVIRVYPSSQNDTRTDGLI